MSVSLIRCLLAVLALSELRDAVASKDVAQLLGVKRPTIHRTLQLLVEKGLIEKELYGDVFLTEKGPGRGACAGDPAGRSGLALCPAVWPFSRGKPQGSLCPDERIERRESGKAEGMIR